MNPVTGYTMLNFLHWLARRRFEEALHHLVSLQSSLHSRTRKLEGSLSEEELLRLVNEFENGKLDGDEILKRKWISGFQVLLESEDDWKGYGAAREELKEFNSRLSKRGFAELSVDKDRVDTIHQRFLQLAPEMEWSPFMILAPPGESA